MQSGSVEIAVGQTDRMLQNRCRHLLPPSGVAPLGRSVRPYTVSAERAHAAFTQCGRGGDEAHEWTALFVGVLCAAALFAIAASTIGRAADRDWVAVRPWRALCTTQLKGHVPTSLSESAERAQLFSGLGTFHRQVSTGSKQTQTCFDHGIRFFWAFNHDEVTRSFAQAAQDDPQCAICYWGDRPDRWPDQDFESCSLLW